MSDHKWSFDERDDTWKTGTEFRGAGVFLDKKGWTANVIVGDTGVMLDYYNECDDAMKAAEEELERLIKEIE
tara:strand:+ start:59019 stop:59234 length:216 start_codon:yes stop_codon:yes gene_type:complete